MGGLRQLMPKTYVAFLVGALALVGHPAALRLLLEGLDPRRGARRRRVRRAALRRRAGRRVPDRPLHVPHDLPRLRRRAVAPACASTCRRPHGGNGEGPCVDDLDGRRPHRARRDRRLAPVRRRLDADRRLARPGRASRSSSRARRRSSIASVLAVGLGLAGIARRLGRSTARARRAIPRAAAVQRVARAQVLLRRALRRVFYRPAVALAHALARWVEGPLVGGSIDGDRHAAPAGSGCDVSGAPDRARAHVRARDRRRRRRPRPRLRLGPLMDRLADHRR